MKKYIHFRPHTILAFVFTAMPLNASTLVQNNPFLPPFYKNTKDAEVDLSQSSQTKEQTRFVLKRVAKIGSVYSFSIYDSVTGKGKWVEAGVPYNGFSILKYEPLEKQIHFNWKTTTYTIHLPKPKGEPIELVYLNTGKLPALANSSKLGGPNSNRSADQIEVSSRSDYENNPHLTIARKRSSNSGQPIVFQQQPANLEYPVSQFDETKNDLFAAIDPNISLEAVIPGTIKPRYKVKRTNTVDNPSGEKPSHMSYTNWLALKK